MILEELPDEDSTENMYLVSYDFIKEKPHHRFWNNLREIISLTGELRFQYSVYYGNRKGARAVRELATRYRAEVLWYVAFELV